jgi:hypothetical protein
VAAITLLHQLRQRNDQRERELIQMQEQQRQEQMARQEQAANHGITLLNSGAKLKDVETAVGGDASEQGRALWRIIDTTNKRKEQEAKSQQEAQSMGGTLADFYNKSAQTGVPIPSGLEDDLKFRAHVASLESGGQGVTDQADLVKRLAYQNSAFSNVAGMQGAEKAFRDAMRLEGGKVGLREASTLRVDETKRGRDLRDKIAEEQREAAVIFYKNAYQDLLISENGADQANQERIVAAIQSDPALGGVNAPAHLNRIQLEALSGVRSAQGAISVQRNIEDRTGIRVTPRIAQLVVDGKAVEDPFTGLPFRGTVATDRQRISIVSAALEQLASARAVMGKIEASGTGGGSEVRLGSTVRNYLPILAENDPLLNEYVAARDLVGEMMIYGVTGAGVNQAQADRIVGSMPRVSELIDKKTGRLSKNAKSRMELALRLTYGLISGQSLAGPQATRDAFEKAFAVRVSQYNPKTPDLLSALPGGAAQQTPGVQIPGAHIRTGP